MSMEVTGQPDMSAVWESHARRIAAIEATIDAYERRGGIPDTLPVLGASNVIHGPGATRFTCHADDCDAAVWVAHDDTTTWVHAWRGGAVYCREHVRDDAGTGPAGPGMADTYVVRRGRTRKGRRSDQVIRRTHYGVIGRHDTTVTGAPVTAPVGTVGDLLDTAWHAVAADVLDAARLRADGTRRGLDLETACRTLYDAYGVMPRMGADGIQWSQVAHLGAGTSVAGTRLDKPTDLSGDTPANVHLVPIGKNDNGTVAYLSVPREWADSDPDGFDVVSVAAPIRTGGSTRLDWPTRYRMPIARRRKSESVAALFQGAGFEARDIWWFGDPVEIDPLYDAYTWRGMMFVPLPGPVMDDGRVFIGHALIERGRHAGSVGKVAADAARVTVDGVRVSTVRAARTVAEIDQPESMEGAEIAIDMLEPGEALTFIGTSTVTTVTRAASGRYRMTVRYPGRASEHRNARTPGAVARLLLKLAD